MTKDERTPEEIAKGLTVAGAEALLMAERSGHCSRKSRMHDWMKYSLPKGLAVDRGGPGNVAGWQLTSLGLAVAAALRRSSDSEGA